VLAIILFSLLRLGWLVLVLGFLVETNFWKNADIKSLSSTRGLGVMFVLSFASISLVVVMVQWLSS
jgi:hypothetical protein